MAIVDTVITDCVPKHGTCAARMEGGRDVIILRLAACFRVASSIVRTWICFQSVDSVRNSCERFVGVQFGASDLTIIRKTSNWSERIRTGSHRALAVLSMKQQTGILLHLK